jgi:hypothetical protein
MLRLSKVTDPATMDARTQSKAGKDHRAANGDPRGAGTHALVLQMVREDNFMPLDEVSVQSIESSRP